MNRTDIENCTDIEALKELCHAYRRACSGISESLVEESKCHINIETAVGQIRKCLWEMDNAEDKFVKKMEESV